MSEQPGRGGENGSVPTATPPDRTAAAERTAPADRTADADPTAEADGTPTSDRTMAAEPPSGRRWVRRSGRDRRARARLEFLDEEGIVVLNDRRIPGSRASIRYLVVAPAGVFVVDAKDVKGLVHTKRPGPISALGPDELHVGRHDCTPLIGAITEQVEAVRAALRSAPGAGEIPVRAMLCLPRAQWGFASPIELGDVWVGWPKLVGQRVRNPVVMDSPMVNEVST
ncbi:MAG TPA: nuclease-related domain-containing protein, partial [Acidimicrobiales bacterium]|nr:nuclease-related domain-containing protein [Acidimicrobiales bacterium]